MEYKLKKVKKNEMKYVLNFINYCFNIKFEECVGKLYRRGVNTSRYHYVILNNEKIIAAICINKSEWNIDSKKLKVAGIGSVCVHPDYRNRGIMQYMLNESNKIIRNMKADISVLSGEYKRYNHFNYEITDACLNYKIDYSEKENNNEYDFIELNKLSTEDIKKCNKIKEKKLQFIKRLNQTFVESCYQWNHSAYGIFMNNSLIGYIIIKKNYVEEIELIYEEKLIDILNSFMYAFKKKSLILALPTIEYNQILKLNRYKHKRIENNHQMCQIINFEKVIKILLDYKNKYKKLKKGTLTIKITSYGIIKIKIDRTIEVSIKKDIPYDIELNYNEALKLMLNKDVMIPTHVKELCESWFPLDIYFHVPDLI